MFYKSCQVCSKLISSKRDGGKCYSKTEFKNKRFCSNLCYFYYQKISTTKILFECHGEICFFTVKGGKVLIDKKDIATIKDCQFWPTSSGYIHGSRSGEDNKILLHHFILGKHFPFVIDHINKNKLDNTRKNLRIVSLSENGLNKFKSHKNKTGYLGVSKRKHVKTYMASISIKRKHYYLGDFKTPEDASKRVEKFIIDNNIIRHKNRDMLE